MELYIFNRELEFQGIIDSYNSLRWIRKYYKVGEFELHCNITANSLDLLKREYIIWKNDDEEAGYIEYRNLKQNEDGSETLVIKGKFLTGYFNRRIIWGTEYLSGTVEMCMRQLVSNQCINPIDNTRIIPKLELGELKSYTKTLTKQVSYDNLLDQLEIIGNTYELGYRIKFNVTNNNLLFDIYRGVDRSVTQSINSTAIFSKEFDNILEQEFTDSLNNYKNIALIGGQGEGSDRKLTSLGESIGLDRFELFVDAKEIINTINSNGSTTVLSESEYITLLLEKGNTALSETKEIQTFDNKININSNLKYRVDFDLGDIVTCISKKWGIVLDSRIIEIEEIYEESGHQINIVFGNHIPTLIDKIKSIGMKQSGSATNITTVDIKNIDGGSFV